MSLITHLSAFFLFCVPRQLLQLIGTDVVDRHAESCQSVQDAADFQASRSEVHAKLVIYDGIALEELKTLGLADDDMTLNMGVGCVAPLWTCLHSLVWPSATRMPAKC